MWGCSTGRLWRNLRLDFCQQLFQFADVALPLTYPDHDVGSLMRRSFSTCASQLAFFTGHNYLPAASSRVIFRLSSRVLVAMEKTLN